MPSIPLSIYLLMPSSIFILVISIYLFFKNKNKSSVIFLIAGSLQFFWMVGTFLMWLLYSNGLEPKNLLVIKMLSFLIFLIPVFLFHFSVEFCQVKGQKLFLFVAYLISILLIAINNSENIVKELFFFNWLSFDKNNYIYYFFAIFAIALLGLTLYNFSRALIEKGENKESKKDILAFLLLIFVVFGIMFIYFLPQNGINIYPLFYLTIPIYALVLGYIIIEKNSFTSVLTIDIIIAAILSFLASFLIFPDVELGIVAKSAIFTLISFVSFLLIRNMNKISGQKTEFEKLIKERTKELEQKTVFLNEANEKLEESNAILEITVKARTRELQELNENLEAEIQKRTKELSNKTKELEEKIEELQQFSNIFINRENKMVELKDEIKKLKERSKE